MNHDRKMTHGSLFSGIGGFDLAAEWMGWENVFHCEWNPFGQKILKYYWPKAISYEDITKTDFTIHRGKIDILTGGFPCQPYSVAGKRKGKEDERHLWPEMLRAIREIQPRWVVGENVLGLVNWNGGLVFHEVQTDLESQGYEVQPYVLPACAINAPHRRDRVWFVAYSTEFGYRRGNKPGNGNKKWSLCESEEKRPSMAGKTKGCCSVTPDTSSKSGKRLQSEQRELSQSEQGKPGGTCCQMGDGDASHTNSGRQSSKKYREKKSGWIAKKSLLGDWQNFPTQSPICDGDDGISSRLDGITFPKWRNESIKAGGNAIVPQVAYQIFKAIIQTENKISLKNDH